MTSFEQRPEEWNRLDYHLLRDHPVTLYCKQAVLDDDLLWLEGHGYKLHRFDAASWSTLDLFHDEVSRTLGFPDYYGRNLDALSDCLSDLEVPEVGGAVLVFMGFDKFAGRFPDQAWHVCDILTKQSRRSLLCGRRLLALAQSDDPRIQFEVVGATPVGWNPREWPSKNRGLWGAS
jgi:RNAse (barnase) inhibitor barstar